jgi:hypothetical protein
MSSDPKSNIQDSLNVKFDQIERHLLFVLGQLIEP